MGPAARSPRALLFALALLCAGPAGALDTYTDEAAWTAAVGAVTVDALDTTAANLTLADEVAVAPGTNTQLGPQLTFRATTTGLCSDFVLQTREAGAGLTFDDGEGSGPIFPVDTISIGDINNYEEDDFRIAFTTRAVHGFGVFLVDNNVDPGERFRVFGERGVLGEIDEASIPPSGGGGSAFLGVVSDEPILSVRFDEGAGFDDMAIRDFRLACANEDPDADGLANLPERRAGTDPDDDDSDDDGLLDGEEVASGVFVAEPVIATDTNAREALYAADLDGDGDNDVLSPDQNDETVSWFENTDGNGSFGPEQVFASPPVGEPQSALAADIDGDGDLDSVSGSASTAGLEWNENTDGLGTFGGAQSVNVGSTTEIFAVDVDGDADMDLFGGRSWYENTDGLGTFATGQPITALLFAFERVIAADVDGDGDDDALSASYLDDRIAWYENSDGAGTFGADHTITTSADGAWSVFAADIDGDGDNDVLSASEIDDTIAWYKNIHGTGSFGPRKTITALADGARAVWAEDLDGDGDVDVLATSVSDTTLAWYENTDGAGTFGPEQIISSTVSSSHLFVADLDTDGDFDVLVPDITSPAQVLRWYRQVNTTDPLDPDSDDDALLDGVETGTGVYIDPSDTGTDPLDADSDGDGFLDGFEVYRGSDPNDPGSVPEVAVPTLAPLALVTVAIALTGLGLARLGRR